MHEFAIRLHELADFLSASHDACGEYIGDLEESRLVDRIVEVLIIFRGGLAFPGIHMHAFFCKRCSNVILC